MEESEASDLSSLSNLSSIGYEHLDVSKHTAPIKVTWGDLSWSLRPQTTHCTQCLWSVYSVYSGLWSVYNVYSGLWSVYNVYSGLWSVYNVYSGLWSVYNVYSGLWSVYNVNGVQSIQTRCMYMQACVKCHCPLYALLGYSTSVCAVWFPAPLVSCVEAV